MQALRTARGDKEEKEEDFKEREISRIMMSAFSISSVSLCPLWIWIWVAETEEEEPRAEIEISSSSSRVPQKTTDAHELMDGWTKEYKDNKGSAISCLYSIADRSGGGQEMAVCARDVSRTRHSHLAGREMLNLH
jgi:hypothetical protein